MGTYDFGGYATRNDLVCSDKRIIRRDAFKDNDGTRVPLVWNHIHDDPMNVIGHADLENRPDGVYAYVNNDILKYKHLTQDYKDYNPDKGPDKPAVVHETETDTDEAPQVETNEHGELSDMIVTDAEDAHSTPEASVYSIESSESKIDTGTHLISYEEYNHETEYRKQYLYYFPNEDVLVATESDPPLNPNSFIGEEAYDILVNDDLESDDERVYVRNDKSQVCYAIVYKTDVDWYEWSGRESIDGEGISLN